MQITDTEYTALTGEVYFARLVTLDVRGMGAEVLEAAIDRLGRAVTACTERGISKDVITETLIDAENFHRQSAN